MVCDGSGCGTKTPLSQRITTRTELTPCLIADLKKQHHQQLQALRDALKRGHGENLDLRRELARRGANQSPANAVSIAT
jgi:hypothetical protein